MKKTFLFIGIMLTLMACKKELLKGKSDMLTARVSSTKVDEIIVYSESSSSEERSFTAINSCYGENVIFTGTISYVTELISLNGVFCTRYTVSSQLKGTGQISHYNYIGSVNVKGIAQWLNDDPDIIGSTSINVTCYTYRTTLISVKNILLFIRSKDGSIYTRLKPSTFSCK